MEDITPLNLEDSPKLFGMRYDQIIAVGISLVASTQFYTYFGQATFAGHAIGLWISLLFALIGPLYALITLNHSAGYWENLLNFYAGSTVFIPGPDPNPSRFLLDEPLPDFIE
ncbi:MAG: hypothetical protein JSS86_20745 [Cyanobacteria bacterium SZAS LIN-2]|nr:hypothetical protein [Cyanobacteria bacterium SZAS LIN-2]